MGGEYLPYTSPRNSAITTIPAIPCSAPLVQNRLSRTSLNCIPALLRGASSCFLPDGLRESLPETLLHYAEGLPLHCSQRFWQFS